MRTVLIFAAVVLAGVAIAALSLRSRPLAGPAPVAVAPVPEPPEDAPPAPRVVYERIVPRRETAPPAPAPKPPVHAVVEMPNDSRAKNLLDRMPAVTREKLAQKEQDMYERSPARNTPECQQILGLLAQSGFGVERLRASYNCAFTVNKARVAEPEKYDLVLARETKLLQKFMGPDQEALVDRILAVPAVTPYDERHGAPPVEAR
ncbi:MAG TPA: hypothetical protein VHH73_16525 [Verrucomicrobiae bacterium]|nr:hypothetical protein [Verrucomicrobiae bacterium]